MKKLAFGMAVAIAAVCIGASSAFAASQNISFGAVPDSAAGSGYIDTNGDGVCDNRLSGACGNYIDADRNGVCDNCLSGSCGNYADANGDGICDNRLPDACGNYIDSDGDGICDRCLNSRCAAGTAGGCAQNRHGNRNSGSGCHGGRHQ